MQQLVASLLLLAVTTTTGLSRELARPAAAGKAQDAQINKELDAALKRWEKAFNAKDAAGVASLYAAKTNVIYEDNVHHRNRKSVQEGYETRFKEEPNLRTVITDVERLFVSPTLVIETGIWANTGAMDSSRPTRGRYSCTLQKTQGRWLIIHDRSWAMPLAEGRSDLRTRDPLSKKARDFFKAFAADDRKFLNEIFADDVEVWINDVKVTGKTAYLARAHHIAGDLFKKLSFDKLHVHTNYFSASALASDGKTVGELHDGPVVWTNAWFELGAVGRTTNRQYVIRDHLDLRWEDGRIVEMLVYGDPSFMEEEEEAFQAARKGARVTRSDFKEFSEAHVGSWTGQVTSVISDADVGKGGKSSTYRWESRLSDDGRAMTMKGVGPDSTGRVLFYLDAAAGKIRSSGVSSGGVVNQQTVHRAGKNKWTRRTHQTAPDGSTSEFRSVLTFSENGSQLTIVIHGKNADGGATKQTNVWRRTGE